MREVDISKPATGLEPVNHDLGSPLGLSAGPFAETLSALKQMTKQNCAGQGSDLFCLTDTEPGQSKDAEDSRHTNPAHDLHHRTGVHPPPVEIPPDAIKLPFMPDLQQPTDYSCGLVAQCIARAYGVGPDNFEDFMKLMKTSPKEGTYYGNIAGALNDLGFAAKVEQDITKEQLKKLLDEHVPIILSLQAWTLNPNDYNDPLNNNNGHYVIAIGYSEKPALHSKESRPDPASKTEKPNDNENLTFYFMDPSIISQRGYMTWKDLDRRWHENEGTKKKPELSHHLGIIVRPNGLKPVHDTVAEPIE